MSDMEWDVWQSTWQGAAGPLPDVRTRARNAALRQRVDNLAGLALVLCGFGISAFLIARGGGDAEVGWVDGVFTVTVLLGFLWLQRGLRRDGIGNPRAALAFLERRLRAERRGALFGPAVFLLTLAVLSYESHQAIDAAGGLVRVFTAAFLVGGITFMLLVPCLVRRRTRREQSELSRWRQWLDEQGL